MRVLCKLIVLFFFSFSFAAHAKVISAAGCSALSSDITMVVHSLPVPTLTSSDYDNSICEATPVTFTAGGGSNYEFFINNVSLGVSSPSNLYSTTALADGDAVKVKVIDVNACCLYLFHKGERSDC